MEQSFNGYLKSLLKMCESAYGKGSGRRKIGIAGFTAALDLPDGIENHSLKELVEEGIPSLYGYSDGN
ncbi:hypothetical protein IJG93_04025 [Candidatus Saccharibacteria bacterium]|nr:hypothetical protein [Candidatus Saccharibacteria bacterium]